VVVVAEVEVVVLAAAVVVVVVMVQMEVEGCTGVTDKHTHRTPTGKQAKSRRHTIFNTKYPLEINTSFQK
jgi:hypothetical protein